MVHRNNTGLKPLVKFLKRLIYCMINFKSLISQKPQKYETYTVKISKKINLSYSNSFQNQPLGNLISRK